MVYEYYFEILLFYFQVNGTLKLNIDGVEKYSGSNYVTNWQGFGINVDSGTHTYEWILYEYGSSGYARLDAISFPD